MSDAVIVDFGRPIPLFPLGAAALLPHATIPLFVFEPRYRAMVRDALEGDSLIAMAVFEGEGWKEDYEGRPPLREHVCVGRIARHEQTLDGRFHILLQGLCRARIRQEMPLEEPYRQALLEPVEMEPAMEIDLEDRREELEEMLTDPLMSQLASVKLVQKWISRDLTTAALVDLVTLAMATSEEERYAMLAEANPVARAQWLSTFLEETRRVVKIASRFGSGMSEEGWGLN